MPPMGGCGPGRETTWQTDSGISIGEKHKKKIGKEGVKISVSKDGIVVKRRKRRKGGVEGGGRGGGWSRIQ